MAATAIVHLANNIFKVARVGREADFGIVLKFALPAALAAMFGALLLSYMATVQPITEYVLGGRTCSITPVKLVIAGALAAFLGAFIGSRLPQKITMRAIQTTVGVMLLLLSIALGTGLVR